MLAEAFFVALAVVFGLAGVVCGVAWIVRTIRSGERYWTIVWSVLIWLSFLRAVSAVIGEFMDDGWPVEPATTSRAIGWGAAVILVRRVAHLETPRPSGGKP